MPWFNCFIRGENFRLSIDNKVEDVGFYTSRYVKANSAEEAERLVLESLKQEHSVINELTEVLQNPEARVFFEEVIETSEKPDEPNKGFTFFRMEEK